MPEGWNKYQYSQFDNLEGQYVVRTDDPEEFTAMVKKVKMTTGKAFESKLTPPPTQNSAPNSGDRPKVPYMWAGDTCPLCHKGVLIATIKETRDGKKYSALVCDQDGCYGKAYPSKYPKKTDQPTIHIDENDDLPF